MAVGGALISWHGDDNAVGGREVYPAASRPVQVPSPGRTGSGPASITPPWGVICSGEPGWVWEYVPGGVVWSGTCDGWVTFSYAFVAGAEPTLYVWREDSPLADARSAPWEASWPESEWANVRAVDACESSSGSHPDTYRLDAIHGGRMQIARAVWADFFAREYGWSWEQVVRDDAIHFRAARIIWERAGSWQPWPNCARGLY